MPFAIPLIAFAFMTSIGLAQAPDGSDKRQPSDDPRVMLAYAQFDPSISTPMIPSNLQAAADTNLFIVQFKYPPTDEDRNLVRQAGGEIKGYMPHDAHIVKIRHNAMALYALDQVRWVGAYEPAYRLEPFLLEELARGLPATRDYNMVMADKRNDKLALRTKIQAMGGEVVNEHVGGLLFTVRLTGQQLLKAARLDEVLWIDRDTVLEQDMDNARIQGGADFLETAAGYTGAGIRGHVYEGVEGTHPDFNTTILQVGPATCLGAERHGHCTAGIIFGNGTSAPQARGLAPDAVGFFTTYLSSSNTTCATSPARNAIIDTVINTNNCMFTTASWGNARTFFYTSVSADADDIVFDHRIPWTQSQSNAGNQDSRPQAWAKNVISVGAFDHYNNSDTSDDSWLGGSGSTGPAQDGRSKPDLSAYYDQTWTSDLTGSAGYSSGNSYTNFGGTSGATPIVAGFNALAIQMYTDQIFSNLPRVSGGSRFENRPYAQTLKALQIACADMLTPTATDNRREHVGWGMPNVQNMYERRDKVSIIPEDITITQGSTRTYQFEVDPNETIVKFVMTYLDPAGNPAAAIDRINDLDMRVTSPTGTQYWGNWGLDGAGQTNQSLTGGSRDSRDTVEVVVRDNPTPGVWTVAITAPVIAQDAYVATASTDAVFALVVNGGRRVIGSGCAEYLPDVSPTYGGSGGSGNYFPWGGYTPTVLDTVYASNNGGSAGGTVYFDVTITEPVWIHSLMVNTTTTAGEDLYVDLYTTSGGYAGNELTAGAWTPRSAGHGVAAGQDLASQVDLAKPFRLSAGTYGFAINANNFGHRYTNGANSYTQTVMTVDAGAATNGLFGGGSVFSPRSANVSIKFRTATSYGQNMRYHTILRSDEIGGAGNITGLAFSGQSAGRHFNSNLLIQMAHRPAGYLLDSTYANNISGGSVVLSSDNYSWQYADGTWRNVGLQNPFAYDGSSDVVVEILARGNVQTTTGSADGPFGRDPTRDRIYSLPWDTTVPTTGSYASSSALRMRVEFSCGSANEYGASCGTLEASHLGSGNLGTNFTFRVANATPSLVAFIGLGDNNSAPYPLSLTVVGFTNCTAFSQSIVILSQPTDPSGSATNTLAIPNNTALNGYKVYGQWIGFDTSEPGDLTFSNVTSLTVGSSL